VVKDDSDTLSFAGRQAEVEHSANSTSAVANNADDIATTTNLRPPVPPAGLGESDLSQTAMVNAHLLATFARQLQANNSSRAPRQTSSPEFSGSEY
jgi:hypothetical protein